MAIDFGDEDSNLNLLIFQALRLYSDGALVQFLRDQHETVRGLAARELQVRGSQIAFDAATALIAEATEDLRDLGYFMLGQIGRDRPFKAHSIPVLRVAFENECSSELKSQCIAALGHLRADDCADLMLTAAQSESADVRQSAAAAIGGLAPTAELSDSIDALLLDADQDVREWAEVSRELHAPVARSLGAQ